MYCPFKMKYDKEGKIQSKQTEYEESLRKCILFFWWHKRNGRTLSIAELKNRWRYIYKYNNDEAVSGAEELWNFYSTFHKDKSVIKGIDIKNTVKIGDHTINIGIDLVRGSQYSDLCEIVRFSPGKVSKEFAIASDVELTLQSLAYRQWYNKKEDRIIVYYPKRNKSYYVIKGDLDYQRITNIINSIAVSIENNILIPRANCYGCEHQTLCLKGVKVYE